MHLNVGASVHINNQCHVFVLHPRLLILTMLMNIQRSPIKNILFSIHRVDSAIKDQMKWFSPKHSENSQDRSFKRSFCRVVKYFLSVGSVLFSWKYYFGHFSWCVLVQEWLAISVAVW